MTVVLHPGIDEPYAPPLTLEHDSKLNELYVNRGEEAAGMIEHVPARQYEEIALIVGGAVRAADRAVELERALRLAADAVDPTLTAIISEVLAGRRFDDAIEARI